MKLHRQGIYLFCFEKSCLRSFVFLSFFCLAQILKLNSHDNLFAMSNNRSNINYTNKHNGNRFVYLEKNNYILTQEMLAGPNGEPLENTTFIIQYDYTLKGDLYLPDNSKLEFDGGSINSGNIVGKDSQILTYNDKVLKNVTLSGIWKNKAWDVEWFETDNYSSLVNMIVRLNCTGKKNIIFHKSKHYFFSQPIVVYGQSGIEFDFNNCFIDDAIDDYYQASYNSFIYISNSSNIIIKELNYRAINKNTNIGVGGYNPVIIRIGDSEYTVHNIEVKNIQVFPANAPSTLSLIDIIGDTYNCVVDGIECNENISYGINCEYGKKDNKIKYPHNIIIRNITGNNIPHCLGFLRASCGYNLLFENCNGYNVQCFIDIWSGDSGSDGVVNNISFLNCCCVYDDNSYIGDKEPVKIDNGRRLLKKDTEIMNYPMALIFTNCHIINKGMISGKHAMAIKDTQAPISISNCNIKGFKYAANIDYSRKVNKPILYEGKDNNLTFNHCFIEGQLSATRASVSFIDCYLKSNGYDKYLIKANDATRLYLQANTIECNDRNSCIFVGSKANNGIIINNRFIGSSNAYDLNIPCVISNNIYNGDIGKASYMITRDDGTSKSGSFKQKPKAEDIYVGFHYFCMDRRAKESDGYGIEIIHKGDNVWVDALGRIIK